MKNGLAYNETKFIDSEVKKLGDLISNLSLTIPSHQRDYSWGEEEVEEFLNDIEYLMVQNFESLEALPHFLGSFVFIKNNNKEYEIIDGQQRITTSMLYFNSIRLLSSKYLDGNDLSTINTRVHEYIYKNKAGQKLETRLKLSRGHDFFKKLLESQNIEKISDSYNSLANKKDVDINLFNAFAKIYNHIEKSLKENYYQILLKYIEAVQTMMVAIEIVVQEPGIAYIVFETLNARGKELTSSNLIKNELLKYAKKQDSFDDILSIWSLMVEEITQYPKSDVTDFLINSFWSNFKYIPQNNLFLEIKILLKDKKAIDYIKTIENDYINYLKISGFNKSISDKFSKSIINNLEELNEFLNIKRIYPLVLAGAYMLNKDEFEDLVKKSINFSFRYKTVLNKSADSLVKIISDLSVKLRNNNIILDDIFKKFKEEANDNDFKTEFINFRPRTNKLAFYVIKKIEDYLSNGQGIQVLDQSPTQHLEHIMPKKPTSLEWGHIYNGNEIDEKFNIYINKIGNLTVLEKDINLHIKNKSFNFKNNNNDKKDYKNSVLKLPAQLEEYLVEIENNEKYWNFNSIEERGKKLAELAINVWDL